MINFFIVWYLLGMLFWCTAAVIDQQFYEKLENPYYTWMQANYVFLVLIILLRPEEVKPLRPILLLMVIELVYQVTSWIFGINIDGDFMVNSLFIITIIICLYYLMSDQKRRWRKLK